MERDIAPRAPAAIYGSLAHAQAALDALLAAGVAYEHTLLGAHSGDDPLRAQLRAQLPEQFWSLAVKPGGRDARALAEILAAHAPLAAGHMRAPELERSEAERGAAAWGHIVFESPASTTANPEMTGTSGTTGVASSGAFADGARVQREPGDKR